MTTTAIHNPVLVDTSGDADYLHIRVGRSIASQEDQSPRFQFVDVAYRRQRVDGYEFWEELPGGYREMMLMMENARLTRRVLDLEDEISMEKADRYQYYYRDEKCHEINSLSTRCICWHDEGTGPLPTERYVPETRIGWRKRP